MSQGGIYTPHRDVGYLLPEETTGHPLRCVSLLVPDTLEYRAALVRQLYDLGEVYVWDRTDQAQAESAAQVWRDTLQSSFTMFDDAPCPTDETGCSSFSPGAPFIQWFPNDPYNTPDLVPAGYASPPWYLATTASNLAYGSSTGDVITTLDRLPPGSLPDVLPSSGLPRFRINVTGEGEVNIHLVNLFAGSIIQLTKDDDPLTVKFIDVSKDVISVPPETLDEFIVSVEFDTPGAHWVDCIVLAWVNDTFPFLFFGAGLRQVDLCGFADMPLVPPTMIRSDPSGCGNLEKSTDGGTTWTDIPDTDFLRRDGICAMTGGLEIFPTANQVALTMKNAVNPYQAAKIMVVQDGAGVDRAWINPRGSMALNSGADTYGLELITGWLGMANSQRLNWKDGAGSYQLGIQGASGALSLYGMGGGINFYRATQNSLMTLSEAGVLALKNTTAATGKTQFTVSGGAGQVASDQLFGIRNKDNVNIGGVQESGQAFYNYQDAGTSNVPDTLIVGHESTATPGAGFGTGIRLQAKSSTTQQQAMAHLSAKWFEATHATRKGEFLLYAMDYTGDREVIHGRADGATALIGFLGAPVQPRLAISGDHHKNAITKQIVEALALFGLITDATTDTASFVISGETGGFPLFDEIIDSLEAYSDYFVDATSPGECEIVCEVPPPEFWCKEFDFDLEEDRAPWVIERGIVGTGFESTLADEMVFIHTAQFETFRIISVTIFYDQSGVADATMLYGAYDFAGYTSHDWGNVDPGTGQQVLIDFSPTYDAFTGFRIVATSTDPFQQVRIRGLKVEGYDMGIYGVIEAGTDCP